MARFALYSPLAKWKQGDLSAPVFVQLATKERDKEGDYTLLSCQLVCDKEIDDVIEEMKSELENLRKTAKKELGSIQERMRGK